MIILFDKKFDKRFIKQAKKVQEKFFVRLKIFGVNQFNSVLNNDKLTGKYEGCWSINVTGNHRAIYKILIEKDREIYVFIAIGTHPELYE